MFGIPVIIIEKTVIIDRGLTAKELQEIKTQYEIAMASMLGDFNQLCADNGIQVEQIKIGTIGTDHNREFECDIHII